MNQKTPNGYQYGFKNPLSVTNRFKVAMQEELQANEEKGEWLNLPVDYAIQDLVYHVAKLVIAVEKDDAAAIHEYAVDVANEAMIVADIKAVVGMDPAPKPILLNEVLGIPINDKDELRFVGQGSDDKEGLAFKNELADIAGNFVKRTKDWALITEVMKNAPEHEQSR